jgi:hypothetical protein
MSPPILKQPDHSLTQCTCVYKRLTFLLLCASPERGAPARRSISDQFMETLKRDSGMVGFLNDLCQGPPEVMRALCDVANLHRVMVGSEATEGAIKDGLLERLVQGGGGEGGARQAMVFTCGRNVVSYTGKTSRYSGEMTVSCEVGPLEPGLFGPTRLVRTIALRLRILQTGCEGRERADQGGGGELGRVQAPRSRDRQAQGGGQGHRRWCVRHTPATCDDETIWFDGSGRASSCDWK